MAAVQRRVAASQPGGESRGAVPTASPTPGGSRFPAADGSSPDLVSRAAAPVRAVEELGSKPAHVNTVLLVGRLAADPVLRELPSGDLLLSWRLVVQRPSEVVSASAGRRPPSVDTLDCATFLVEVQDQVAGWSPGEVVEVAGALRRRFWRAAAGVASRCEVEVTRARRLATGPPEPSGVGEGAQH